MTLPPLRRIDAVTTPPGAEPRLAADVPGCDRQRARAFGALLAEVRRARDLDATGLRVFVSDGHPATAPPELPGVAWAPHLVAWAPAGDAGLAWEADTLERLTAALDAPAKAIAVWAEQPAALLRIAAAAPAVGPGDPYLSLRWLLAHPREAVVAATAHVAFDHVSVHVTPEEMTRVRAVLREALGLVEVPRPGSIEIPGHWLAAGLVRVHLNARGEVAQAAQGTAPNHICFSVEDLGAAQTAVEAHGFACERAGSLNGQVWFRLDSGTVIELQPRRR